MGNEVSAPRRVKGRVREKSDPGGKNPTFIFWIRRASEPDAGRKFQAQKRPEESAFVAVAH